MEIQMQLIKQNNLLYYNTSYFIFKIKNNWNLLFFKILMMQIIDIISLEDIPKDIYQDFVIYIENIMKWQKYLMMITP